MELSTAMHESVVTTQSQTSYFHMHNNHQNLNDLPSTYNHQTPPAQPEQQYNQHHQQQQDQNQQQQEPKMCAFCGKQIRDKFIMKVSGNFYLHELCLKCNVCFAQLEQTCFVINSKFYCRDDYERLKANNVQMLRQQQQRQQQMSAIHHLQHHTHQHATEESNLCNMTQNHHQENSSLSPSSSSASVFGLSSLARSCIGDQNKDLLGDSGSNTNDANDQFDLNADGKRRGPRTTIKPKQLDALKRAFDNAPKPPRHVRESLARETGLNMRVIQVWFQNRRSKERRMKNSTLSARRNFFRSSSRRIRVSNSNSSTLSSNNNTTHTEFTTKLSITATTDDATPTSDDKIIVTQQQDAQNANQEPKLDQSNKTQHYESYFPGTQQVMQSSNLHADTKTLPSTWTSTTMTADVIKDADTVASSMSLSLSSSSPVIGQVYYDESPYMQLVGGHEHAVTSDKLPIGAASSLMMPSSSSISS